MSDQIYKAEFLFKPIFEKPPIFDNETLKGVWKPLDITNLVKQRTIKITKNTQLSRIYIDGNLIEGEIKEGIVNGFAREISTRGNIYTG